MSLDLIGAATIRCMEYLDLPSEPFCGHGIGLSDGGDQIYMLAKVSWVGSYMVIMPAIYYS